MKGGILHLAKLYREAMSMGRYKHIAPEKDRSGTGSHHAKWLIEMLIENGRIWPETKSHRWLGYLQRELIDLGIFAPDIIETQNQEAFRDHM